MLSEASSISSRLRAMSHGTVKTAQTVTWSMNSAGGAINLMHKFGRDKRVMATIIALPLLSVLFLVVNTTKASLHQQQQLDLLMHEVTVAEHLRLLITQLQHERSTSCIFLSTHSHEEQYLEVFKRLLRDRLITDRDIEAMRNEPEAWPRAEGFRNANEFKELLAEHRIHIDKQEQPCTEVVEEYHEIIMRFIEQIVYEFEHLGDGKLWGEIHAYASWILAAEETGKFSGRFF